MVVQGGIEPVGKPAQSGAAWEVVGVGALFLRESTCAAYLRGGHW